jgi:hypothetical protein
LSPVATCLAATASGAFALGNFVDEPLVLLSLLLVSLIFGFRCEVVDGAFESTHSRIGPRRLRFHDSLGGGVHSFGSASYINGSYISV